VCYPTTISMTAKDTPIQRGSSAAEKIKGRPSGGLYA
jgi:hypothetical protein